MPKKSALGQNSPFDRVIRDSRASQANEEIQDSSTSTESRESQESQASKGSRGGRIPRTYRLPPALITRLEAFAYWDRAESLEDVVIQALEEFLKDKNTRPIPKKSKG